MSSPHSDSEVVSKGPCPACDSSDAFMTYDDGHGYCFSCHHYAASDPFLSDDGEPPAQRSPPRSPSGLLDGTPQALKRRQLREETCRKWGYLWGKDSRGRGCHIASYADSTGRIVAQKLRYADKSFAWVGDPKAHTGLYGSHLWKAGGKRIVITEGELDALSVSQINDNKWPVVSLPDGATSAEKCVRNNLEYLESFDTVVLCFDMDERGREATTKVAEILSPGKAAIVTLPRKDASELLQAGEGKVLSSCLWSAAEYRPDTIVEGSELWDEYATPIRTADAPYPWAGLNAVLRGQRVHELVTWVAGEKIGKTTVMAALEHNLLTTTSDRIGIIALEQQPKRTAMDLVGYEMGRRLHTCERVGAPSADERAAFDRTVGSGRVYIDRHFGSLEIDRLLNRIRWLVVGKQCRWIILDHISMVVSGSDVDERKELDMAVTALASFVEERDVGIHMVSHLRRPSTGIPWEEGRKPRTGDIRGTSAIGQLSHAIVGISRNKRSEDEDERSTMQLEVLCNRPFGDEGDACRLRYDAETGRLDELIGDDMSEEY